MKISELWLREWVNPNLDKNYLASKLTMAGLEVDAIVPVAGSFNRVIVAEVAHVRPHPKADRLTLCQVNTGEGELLNVVCGATNVRAGLKVALALVGATLPGDFVIKESVLRGEPSHGMLCSTTELGLADESEGILELDEAAPVGVDLRSYLLLDDHILDINLTPNRADCFSVLGIAREVAAITDSLLKPIDNRINTPVINDTLPIRVDAAQACPQYSGRIIRGINPHAQTPMWMMERLRRSGLRGVHPVVDILNYVMLEFGQPMHAYDLHHVQEEIIVRFSQSNETLILLNNQQIVLEPDVLVIADKVGPLAIAGVMGGSSSAVRESTTDILLESAFFNPLKIVGTARRFGLCTDASQRFERGVDPALQQIALEYATTLLSEITGGRSGPIFQSQPQYLPPKQTILFNPAKVKQLTGVVVPENEMQLMLKRLGMDISKVSALWQVETPTYRFDMNCEEDLVEEIIRLYGYDKIMGQPMVVTPMQFGTIDPVEKLSSSIAHFFVARGYHEAISYSFVDPELQQLLYPNRPTMELLNPLSPELSHMRVGMWPGLLASMLYNVHRQQTAIKLFENGVVFDLKDNVLHEHACVAGLITGEHGFMNWGEESRQFDFFDLKGDLEALFKNLNLTQVHFHRAVHPALHPGKSAQIIIGENEVGWCGALHPQIADTLDLSTEIILFEFNLKLLADIDCSVRYQPISKFPQIRRDLSLLVNEEISIGEIERAIRQVFNNEWLKSFEVFDVYSGESIPLGKKSLTIALILQDNTRTLVDTEIQEIISAIIKKLEEEFSITLRAGSI